MHQPWLVLPLLLIACASPTYHAPAAPTPISLPAASSHVVTIVRIPAPWYARDFVIRRRFAQAVGDYEQVAGLERKYFTISDAREFGGIYLWTANDAAAAFFSPAWHAGVRARYGTDTEVAVMAAPFVVEGTTTLDAEPIDRAASRYPATATLLVMPSQRGELGLRALADVHGIPPGLVRAYFVITAHGELGMVSLWASDDHARAMMDREHLARWEAAAGAPAGAARVTWFAAPVLVANEPRATAGVAATLRP